VFLAVWTLALHRPPSLTFALNVALVRFLSTSGSVSWIARIKIGLLCFLLCGRTPCIGHRTVSCYPRLPALPSMALQALVATRTPEPDHIFVSPGQRKGRNDASEVQQRCSYRLLKGRSHRLDVVECRSARCLRGNCVNIQKTMSLLAIHEEPRG
jgi:hypothetical protein